MPSHQIPPAASRRAAAHRTLLVRCLLGAALLCCAPMVRADQVVFLDDDEQAVLARLYAGQNVQSEFKAAYFMIRPDTAGMFLVAKAVREARLRHTSQLLFDAMHTTIDRKVLAYAASQGVQIRWYHSFGSTLFSNPLDYLRRMHVKMFLVDRNRKVIGARNAVDGAFRDTPRARNLLQGTVQTLKNLTQPTRRKTARYRDLDVYVEGESVEEDVQYFDALFADQKHTSIPRLPTLTSEEARLYGRKIDSYIQVLDRWQIEKADAIRASIEDNALEVNDIQVFQERPDTKGKAPGVEEGPKQLLRSAGPGDVVYFESGYILLTPDLKQEITDAIGRGARVVALTNSRETNDIPMAAVRYDAERVDLVKLGMEIWEYQGRIAPGGEPVPDTVHGKVWWVIRKVPRPGRDVFISSLNTDPLSRNRNLEVGNSFDSPELIDLAMKRFERFRAASVRITPEEIARQKLRPKRLPLAKRFTAACRAGILRVLSAAMRPVL